MTVKALVGSWATVLLQKASEEAKERKWNQVQKIRSQNIDRNHLCLVLNIRIMILVWPALSFAKLSPAYLYMTLCTGTVYTVSILHVAVTSKTTCHGEQPDYSDLILLRFGRHIEFWCFTFLLQYITRNRKKSSFPAYEYRWTAILTHLKGNIWHSSKDLY